MKDVDINYDVFYRPNKYAQEIEIWTSETQVQYYPLSYSLQDCLESICEELGWEYLEYEIFSDTSGILYAMKPGLSPVEQWYKDHFVCTTAASWQIEMSSWTTGG